MTPRLVVGVMGAAVALLGGWTCRLLIWGDAGVEGFLAWWQFAGPVVLAVGVVMVARAVLPTVGLWRQRPLLAIGLVLLLIGGAPWLYTPWLIGDRPGGEAAGMLGTLLFIFAGLPGLVLSVLGWLFRR